METKQSDPSAISTSSVLDALNSNEESSEASEASESEYNNASEATSNSCHRMEVDRIDQGTELGTDSEQGNELTFNSLYHQC